ncbi:MAG: MotA/TolQ/ExbB proton channel family protein [Lentisphaeria bacterium]|nr:MotA/TolQ/ExbB proton channel family protein [Lentisphaeria bacterium]
MFLFATAAAKTSGAWYAFLASDGLGQFIVIFLLLASVITWSLMINKFIILNRAKKLSENFSHAFEKNKQSLSSLSSAAQSDPSPIAAIYLKGIEKLQEFYAINREKNINQNSDNTDYSLYNKSLNNYVSEEQIIAVEAVMESQVSKEITELEYGVSFLATVVSVCPFLGLFGTVWGVMLSFVGMAQAGSADIAAMAPGIASALLTTVVGLVVAIPSVVGYNIITGSIKQIIVRMDNFSETFIAKVKLEQASK